MRTFLGALPRRLPTTAALTGAGTIAALLVALPASAATAAPAAVTGTHPQWAVASADRGAVSAGADITTSVYLNGRDPAGLTAYVKAVSDKSSALYHKYLTPAQYDAAFGPSAAGTKAVENWLTSAGLRIVSADTHDVTVTGTAAATERAYGVALNNYSVGGKTYRAPSDNAQVPASVAAEVLTVGGLDDKPVIMSDSAVTEPTTTKPTASKASDSAPYYGHTPCSTYFGQLTDNDGIAYDGTSTFASPVCGYTAQQLRSAYGVTSSGTTGKGVTVAIVDAYASPTILSDANTLAENTGNSAFTSGQFSQVSNSADWEYTSVCGSWALEETLDVEAVHAMAPGANVVYYGANSCYDSDLLLAFQRIVDTHAADLVSNSWNGLIEYYDTVTMDEYDQIFEQAAAEGIGFSFSSGDCGANDPATTCGSNYGSTYAQTNWPTSSPYVTSVGGTSVAIGSNGKTEFTTPWDDTLLYATTGSTAYTSEGWDYGGGGGTAPGVAEPWYQEGVVPTSLATTLLTGASTTASRVVPDVSMDADPSTGMLYGESEEESDGSYLYYEDTIGGTSLASPLFVGLEADAQQAAGSAIGFANPDLYARYETSALTDVTGAVPSSNPGVLFWYTGSTSLYLLPFGQTDLLKATTGYDDATGLGTPSASFLTSFSEDSTYGTVGKEHR